MIDYIDKYSNLHRYTPTTNYYQKGSSEWIEVIRNDYINNSVDLFDLEHKYKLEARYILYLIKYNRIPINPFALKYFNIKFELDENNNKIRF